MKPRRVIGPDIVDPRGAEAPGQDATGWDAPAASGLAAAAGPPPEAAQAGAFADFGRAADRPMRPPPDVVSGLDERIPWPTAAAFGLQQVATQSVFFVLPLLLAGALGEDPATATNFLCLTALGLAGYGVLQVLTRGPVGSGYPIVAIPSPVLFTAYLLAARVGAAAPQLAALTVLTGLAAVALTPLLRRIEVLLPTEVAGVVVFLIGASLLPVVFATLGLDAAAPRAALPAAALAGGTFLAMAAIGLARWRLAPFAVLLGGLVGVAAAFVFGVSGAIDSGRPAAAPWLVVAPWLALPRPILPDWQGLDWTFAVPFLLCLIASKASLVGSLVAFQRAADTGWRRLDPAPIRRGMLAQGIAIALAGCLGGIGPGSSSACLGLTIATRTLARRIALAGAALLVVLALSPRLMGLFLLVPEPVKAATLLYVAGFMMAQGCQMIVARMLDARRTLVVGIGLSAGLGVLIAPGFFAAAAPPLASPLALGGLAIILAHRLTLPLVARRAGFALRLGPGMADALAARWAALGGGWGLTRPTVRRVEHALIELGDLLAGRGVTEVAVEAWMQEDRLEVVLTFHGPPLPPPARRPRMADLEGAMEGLEAFGVWLATREAVRHRQRVTALGVEFRLEFQD